MVQQCSCVRVSLSLCLCPYVSVFAREHVRACACVRAQAYPLRRDRSLRSFEHLVDAQVRALSGPLPSAPPAPPARDTPTAAAASEAPVRPQVVSAQEGPGQAAGEGGGERITHSFSRSEARRVHGQRPGQRAAGADAVRGVEQGPGATASWRPPAVPKLAIKSATRAPAQGRGVASSRADPAQHQRPALSSRDLQLSEVSPSSGRSY